MAEQDSMVATEAPEANETPAEAGYDFDFMADADSDPSDAATAPDAPDGPSSTPESSTEPADTPDRFDLLRTRAEELPEHLRPMAQQAQEQQRSLQRQFTTVSEQLAQLQRQQADERQQYLSAIQQLQAPAAAGDDPFAGLRAQLGDDAGSIDVVRQIVGLETQAYANQLQQLQQSLDALTHNQSSLQQYFDQQQQTRQSEEVEAAKSKYPDADFSPHAEGIIALRRTVNPTTGQPYTVTEAYERLSGAAADQRAQLQQQQQQTRTQARRRVQSNGVTGTLAGGTGELSRAEALAAFPDEFE